MSEKKEKIGIWIVHITKDFLLRNDLSLQEKALYSILKSFANHKDLTAYPTLKHLVKITGNHRLTVQKHIKGLIKKGCLSKKRIMEDGLLKNNVYTLNERKAEFFELNRTGKRSNNWKNEDYPIGYFFDSRKMDLITITQYLNINIISSAKVLIKNYEEFKTEQITTLSKLINKFKSKLGKDKLVKILFSLAVDGIQFDDISELASYLQSCCRSQEQSEFTLTTDLSAWIS
ncbi:helix-turn-helix domain-containing protein [Bacteroidota bacterium]